MRRSHKRRPGRKRRHQIRLSRSRLHRPAPQLLPSGDATPSPSGDATPASKTDNAFPEDVSKAAARSAAGASSSSSKSPAQQEAKPAASDSNAFPEDVSKAAASAAGNSSSSSTTTDIPHDEKPAAKNENAFPEAISRQAAREKDAQDQPPPPAAPPSGLPPGVSSSQSSSSLDTVEAPAGPDPARARKDEDVGSFYLKKGDYPGALQRYKDASAADPTDVEAMFGLAETQRMLKNNAEAIRNYQMYLAVVPDGPRAKQAMKALKLMQAAH